MHTTTNNGNILYFVDSIKFSNDKLFFYYSLKEFKPKIDSIVIISKPGLPKNIYTYYINNIRRTQNIFLILNNPQIQIFNSKLLRVNQRNTLFLRTAYRSENRMEADFYYQNNTSSKINGFARVFTQNLLQSGESINLVYRKNNQNGEFYLHYVFPYIRGTGLMHGSELFMFQSGDTLQLKWTLNFGYDFQHWRIYAGGLWIKENLKRRFWLSQWGLKKKFEKNISWNARFNFNREKYYFHFEAYHQKRFKHASIKNKLVMKIQKHLDFDIFKPYPLEAQIYFNNSVIKKFYFHLHNELGTGRKNIQPYLAHDAFYAQNEASLPYFIGLGSLGIRIKTGLNYLSIGISKAYKNKKSIDYQSVMINIRYLLRWR